MPFPNKDTQFKPGQSGNPGGYSRSRRVRDALFRLIDEKTLGPELALTLYAMAVGRRAEILKDRDPDKGWFELLLKLSGETDAGPAPGRDGERDQAAEDIETLREFLDSEVDQSEEPG